MNAAALEIYADPGKFPAAVLAIMVHLALFVFLYFGVQWHSVEPDAVSVELVESLPPVRPAPPPQTVVAPIPPENIPEPPPPVPEPKVEPKPAPAPPPIQKVEPKAAPKPDIALKKEQEKKKLQEQQREEQKKLDLAKQKQEAERKQALKEQLRKEQLQLQAQRELAQEQSQREAQRISAKNRANDEYVGKIRSKIRAYIVIPEGIVGNPQALFDVVQLPSGDILSAKLRKSSGNAAYDAAVERAILKSSPLPKPNQPELFQRELNLSFKPQDSN
jgi:colicin import membrane protein